jgi:cyclopropane fatty-acyl-phospholipid synthase-like methyltransferase
VTRDWHEWYRAYDDPASSLSRRLDVVRTQLDSLLASAAPGPVRLLSLCSGDGRDTLPVIAVCGVDVSAVLVELDPGLASAARSAVAKHGLTSIEIRTMDAGDTACAAGGIPADVVMACGIFGNITDQDVAHTISTLPSLLAEGGHVIWTRGRRVPQDPTEVTGDPSETVRALFVDTGFEEVVFVRPDDASFRVGVARWPHPGSPYEAGVRMFDFV